MFSDLLMDRFKGWEQLEEYYLKAQDLREQGETDITLPIDVFLRGKEARKSLEVFCRQLTQAVKECIVVKQQSP